jgi:glyoxylase-like metal-dependent hydrolase (beta-lactamase superfamily II)
MPVGFATALSDASPAPVAVEQSFPGTQLREWRVLTLSGLDANGLFHPNLGCFLVRWHDRLVLCDTGIGPGPNAYLGGLRGRLPEVLAEQDVLPDHIHVVMFTHLHMDHIGWATRETPDGKRVPAFPNATYFVAEAELDYWTGDPADARAHHREAFANAFWPLVGLDRLRTLRPSDSAMPGVSLIPTPGHTPGHSSVLFRVEEGCLVIAGDIFHAPGQIERPAWSHRADMDPEQATKTRRSFIDRAVRENWTIGAGHFRDGFQLGRIVTYNESRRFVPQGADQVALREEPYAFHQGRLK